MAFAGLRQATPTKGFGLLKIYGLSLAMGVTAILFSLSYLAFLDQSGGADEAYILYPQLGLTIVSLVLFVYVAGKSAGVVVQSQSAKTPQG